MSAKPIIGVPADRRVLAPHPFQMVGEKYLAAITDAADALPLITPVMPDAINIDELLARLAQNRDQATTVTSPP